MEKENRIQYIDLLRIIATFFVIVLHVSANNMFRTDINSNEWNVLNIYNSLSRCTVPVFVMISGTLFLSKEVNIKKLFTKNILRIFIAFIFWGIIYILVSGTYTSKTEFVNMLITGKYHMWFLPMIIGLYLLTPVLKKIAEDEKMLKYYLVLTLIISFCIPWIINILSEFRIDKINTLTTSIKTSFMGNLGISFGYTGYFLLGYYLNKIDLSKNARYIIYILGIIGIILTIILTNIACVLSDKFIEKFYDNFSVNVLLEAVAVFVFAKYSFKTNKFIKYISRICFGVFLIHVLIIENFGVIFKFNVLSFNPIASVPAICLLVFLTAGVISLIINQIPILKKYIV